MKKTCLLLTTLSSLTPALAQTPSDLPGLQLWLDGQDAGTINTSGGTVTQWDDKSGNGFHATNADPLRQPTPGGSINGNAAIRFNGALTFNSADPNDDGLVINDGLNMGQVYTIYEVSQYWDGGAALGRTLQSRNTNWLFGKWNGTNSFYGGDGVGFVGSNPGSGINAPVVAQGMGALASAQLSIDGVSNGRLGSGTVSPGRLQIGDATAGGAGPPHHEPARADVGELIIFNRLLADTEQRAMNNYLATKWDTTRPHQQLDATQTTRFSGGDAGEGLDFTGNFVAAINMAGNGGFSVGNAAFTDQTGNPNVTVNAQNTLGPGSWGAPDVGASANDNNLEQVMNSIRWSLGGQSPEVQGTVTGLTPGHAYKVQLIAWDACCPNRHMGVQMNGDTVKTDVTVGEIQGGAGTAAGVGIVHTYLATNGTLDFKLILPDTGGQDVNPILNGFTVEDLGAMNAPIVGGISTTGSLDLNGVFAYALDFGNTGGNKVVDGLTFSAAESASGVHTYAENTLTYHRPELGGDASAEALEDVLHTIRWTQTDRPQENVAVDLTGLTAGQQYKLQLLFADSNAPNRTFDIMAQEMLLFDDYSVGAASGGGMASHLTWEFTAGSTELNLLLNGWSTTGNTLNTGGNDRNPILSGLTLEVVVPEPAAAALSALAALALSARRRRQTAV